MKKYLFLCFSLLIIAITTNISWAEVGDVYGYNQYEDNPDNETYSCAYYGGDTSITMPTFHCVTQWEDEPAGEGTNYWCPANEPCNAKIYATVDGYFDLTNRCGFDASVILYGFKFSVATPYLLNPDALTFTTEDPNGTGQCGSDW